VAVFAVGPEGASVLDVFGLTVEQLRERTGLELADRTAAGSGAPA